MTDPLNKDQVKRMFAAKNRTCPCGSGKERWKLEDARGIFCSYVCDDCHDKVKARYRPEIFKDANYYADEPIDEGDC